MAIIGGGPAGSALAALLARAGRAAVVLERDRFPRGKLCGEFLSGRAQAHLSRIGCLEQVRALNHAKITAARFFSLAGRGIEIELGEEALGQSRRSLDETLFRHAERCGALAFEGAAVTRLDQDADGAWLQIEQTPADGARISSRMRADWVVAAYGRRSGLDEGLGRPFYRRRTRFVGYKYEHAILLGQEGLADELRGAVELHLFDGGFCGVSLVGGGRVNVCLLAENGVFKAGGGSAFLSGLSPSLRLRLEGLRPAAQPMSAAQLTFEAKEPGAGRVLFIGDAAGMIAPLCGDGQGMALESALLLAELMSKTGGKDLLRLWDGLWRRRFSGRLRRGRWLQSLLMRPAAGEAAVRLIEAWPSLAGPLLALTRDGAEVHV